MKIHDSASGYQNSPSVKTSNRAAWKPHSDPYPQSRMGVETNHPAMLSLAPAITSIQWERLEFDARRFAAPARSGARGHSLKSCRKSGGSTAIVNRQDESWLSFELDDNHVTIGSLQHILEGYKSPTRWPSTARRLVVFPIGGPTNSSDDSIPFNGALMHSQKVIVSFNPTTTS